jgi:peptidoglycan-associated lipoprotein
MNTRLIGIAMSALVFLAVTGCASKNVSSTNDGIENGQPSAFKSASVMREDGTYAPGTPGIGSDGRPLPGFVPRLGPDGRPLPGFYPPLGPDGQPLTGFAPGSSGESGVGTGPTMLSKADAQALESREARRLRDEGRKSLADIYFAYDRWGLSEEGKKNLSRSAGFLKENPKAKLIIEGHCDERGSGEYNLALGEKRAKEALQYLTDLGIHNVVAVTSYGKERPSCKEQDEMCYAKNRRAHLLVETN